MILDFFIRALEMDYTFCRIAWICLLEIALFGCGNAPVGKVSDKAPVVSIKKLNEKQVDEFTREVSFKLVAKPPPKTELLVILDTDIYVYDGSGAATLLGCKFEGIVGGNWALISKGAKESQDFSLRVDLNGIGSVGINPIPTISVVGVEGEVVDQKEMDDLISLSDRTLGGHRIPEDFEFPYYQVGKPSDLILYSPKASKIVSIEPPESTRPKAGSPIIITFDAPPKCPFHDIRKGDLYDFLSLRHLSSDDFTQRVTQDSSRFLKRLSPTTFAVRTPLGYRVDYANFILTIEWDQPQEDSWSRTKQSFLYD